MRTEARRSTRSLDSIAMVDWRLQAQHKYLQGVPLVRRTYRRYAKNPDWDHDHCAFCWAKFVEGVAPDALQVGYCTPDEYHWVCDTCFHDFKDQFGWQVA